MRLANRLIRDPQLRRTSLAPSFEHPPHQLDPACHSERDCEGKEQALPRRMLEGTTAEVPEERRVERPDERSRSIEQGEAPPRVPQRPCAQRHRRPSARNETTDHDQLAAPLGELPFGPLDLPPPALPAEEARLDPPAEAATQQ